MSQLDTSAEFVNSEFRPPLLRYLTGDYLEFAMKYGIQDIGMPAPSLEGKDMAVWHTTVPNHAGELGVIAAFGFKGSSETPIIAPLHRVWFCGMIALDTYEKAVIVQDDDFYVPRVLAEHANHGPFLLLKHLFKPDSGNRNNVVEMQGAFNLLQEMYRK